MHTPAKAPGLPSVGVRIVFTLNQQELSGTVGFAGETHFASGKWVGIILDTPTGKNNGSVKGHQYFQCPPNHGLFIRPQNVIHVVTEQEEADSSGSPATRSSLSRPATAAPEASAPQPQAASTQGRGSARPAEGRVGGQLGAEAPRDVDDSSERLETLRTELAVAQAAHELTNQGQQASKLELEALRAELQQAKQGWEEQVSSLQSDLEKAEKASEEARAMHVSEVENSQRLARRECQMNKEALEEVNAFLAKNRRLEEGRQEMKEAHGKDLEGVTTALMQAQEKAQCQEKEVCALKSRWQAEQEQNQARVRELEASVASATSAGISAALSESKAWRTELDEERQRSMDGQKVLHAELQAAGTGRAFLLNELETARFESQAAEMRLKAEQRSFAVQAESAALEASSRELAALKATNQTTAELGRECRARQALLEEVESLRATVNSQAKQQQQDEHLWSRDSILSTFCCGRPSGIVSTMGPELAAPAKKITLDLGVSGAAAGGHPCSAGKPLLGAAADAA